METVQLLTGLPKLRCLECTQGRQSKVVQALSTLHHSTRLNLTHLTFRQPPRPPLHLLNTILPRLWSAKVIWNVFEIGYSSAIDQGLAQLHQLERVTQLALEVGITDKTCCSQQTTFQISTVNMLYVIQLAPKLANISQQITR